MQADQYARLALTMNSLSTDVRCVGEARIQGLSKVIQLAASNVSSAYFLHTSGEEAVRAAGQRGVQMALSDEAERPF